jgi:hypothetical protein
MQHGPSKAEFSVHRHRQANQASANHGRAASAMRRVCMDTAGPLGVAGRASYSVLALTPSLQGALALPRARKLRLGGRTAGQFILG